MTETILAAAAFCAVVSFIHIVSIAIAIARFRNAIASLCAPQQQPAVSIVRPLCGIDNYGEETLRTTFDLDYPHYEILFCVASATDPVLPLVREPDRRTSASDGAKLLIGDDRVSTNPKLNNVIKGWRAAAHEWIIIADSNVLMPRDYVQRLFASWRDDTGLVASPPIGARPDGFWAEIECAFLNTYQARWQYLIDTLGRGFAQGKTMLWRRADLEQAGGIEALAKEVAEDAAATKIVRSAGYQVRLIDRPLAQPLGHRTASEVWNRQLRWARLRRASFFLYFALEIFSGGVLPTLGVAFLAHQFGWPVALSAVGLRSRSGMAVRCCWPRPRTGTCRCSIRFRAQPRSVAAGAVRRRARGQRLRLARQRNAGRAHAGAAPPRAGAGAAAGAEGGCRQTAPVALAARAAVGALIAVSNPRSFLPVIRVRRLERAAFCFGAEALIKVDGAATDRNARHRQAARILVDDDRLAIRRHRHLHWLERFAFVRLRSGRAYNSRLPAEPALAPPVSPSSP